jgi:hypothetical protein
VVSALAGGKGRGKGLPSYHFELLRSLIESQVVAVTDVTATGTDIWGNSSYFVFRRSNMFIARRHDLFVLLPPSLKWPKP